MTAATAPLPVERPTTGRRASTPLHQVRTTCCAALLTPLLLVPTLLLGAVGVLGSLLDPAEGWKPADEAGLWDEPRVPRVSPQAAPVNVR